MAGRAYIRNRAFKNEVTPGTSFNSQLTTMTAGQTLIRVIWNYQLQGEIATADDPAPWIGQQVLLGLIVTTGVTPPTPPDIADELNDDWLWWQSVQFKADLFLQEPDEAVVVYQAMSPSEGINIEAKRGPVPSGQESSLWAVCKTLTTFDANFEFVHIIGCSTIVLDAPS
jgi:hypothetical protein